MRKRNRTTTKTTAQTGGLWRPVAAGGGVGFAIGGPVGAAAGAAITAWFDQQRTDDSEELSDHHRALLRAAREVNYIADMEGGRSASSTSPTSMVMTTI